MNNGNMHPEIYQPSETPYSELFSKQNFFSEAKSEFRKFLILRSEYSKCAWWISDKSVSMCHKLNPEDMQMFAKFYGIIPIPLYWRDDRGVLSEMNSNQPLV